jgi:hypothetical protein
MNLEKLCVKYNCAAVDSQIGGLCNRATEDGIRQACVSFQVLCALPLELPNNWQPCLADCAVSRSHRSARGWNW